MGEDGGINRCLIEQFSFTAAFEDFQHWEKSDCQEIQNTCPVKPRRAARSLGMFSTESCDTLSCCDYFEWFAVCWREYDSCS